MQQRDMLSRTNHGPSSPPSLIGQQMPVGKATNSGPITFQLDHGLSKNAQ